MFNLKLRVQGLCTFRQLSPVVQSLIWSIHVGGESVIKMVKNDQNVEQLDPTIMAKIVGTIGPSPLPPVQR